MPISFKKTVAVCEGICLIEEAETLLEWFIETPKGKVNLKNSEQLHTAIIQVLMAKNPPLSALPVNQQLYQLLRACGLSSACE